MDEWVGAIPAKALEETEAACSELDWSALPESEGLAEEEVRALEVGTWTVLLVLLSALGRNGAQVARTIRRSDPATLAVAIARLAMQSYYEAFVDEA